MNLSEDIKHDRILYEGASFTLYANRVVQQDGAHAEVRQGRSVVIEHDGVSEGWRIPIIETSSLEYRGDFPVLSAAYSLARGELAMGRQAGDAFYTGATWNSLWTRDVAYGTHLGLGIADIAGCRESLRQRVFRGEIIQDTGTGGAWPIATDRLVWAIAAWEVYLMSGDKAWLQWAYDIIEKTCLHDGAVVRDLAGLMRGETSFLDWRSQSYPDWMTPADIGESCALSTMALHARARIILSKMCSELGDKVKSLTWKKEAQHLIARIDELFWMPYHGYYGQFLYGRGYPVLSERPDTLGNLLCVLFGLVKGDRAWTVINHLPHCGMGIPCFQPQKTMTEGDYHNNSTWPFLEGYFGQAAAQVGNETALNTAIGCMVRAVMMFGTNKENLELTSGAPDKLIQSSDRQLWSIAGLLGLFYKGLFGLKPDRKSMLFTPCIPQSLAGEHQLLGIPYRGMTFDLTLRGYGSEITKCRIDGKDAAPLLSADSIGHFQVELDLEPTGMLGDVCQMPVMYDLPAPEWRDETLGLSWDCVEGADYYRIYRNGIPIAQTEYTQYNAYESDTLDHYQVMAVSLSGRESFLNAPREFIPCDGVIETRPCGMKGDQMWLTRATHSPSAYFYNITVAHAGVYRVDAYFANGMGDLKDGNTCALRSLRLNGIRVGSMVFPHSGEQGDWDYFSYSVGLEIPLKQGEYTVELVYSDEDENINYFVNECLIKHLRFVRMDN
ncbi:MAG: hypothetical protein RR888_00945 [Akkermansia sp.]